MIKDKICPNCASENVIGRDDQYWCADGCGAINEVITGQEFANREAWETERTSKLDQDAGCYDDPPYGHWEGM
jgi:hypothetical protein